MDLNSHIYRIIFFWLLITKYGFVSSEKDNFLQNLKRYIKHDREVSQVMLLTDAKESVPEMRKLSQTISTGFQLIYFDNRAATDDQYLSQLASFNNLRSTLFILIISSAYDESLSTLSRSINFITQLHPAKIRPKVLILIHVKISSSYNDLLRYMWSRQFLDATVQELIQREDSSQNHFIDSHQEVANQHYFNPFTDTFIQKKYYSKSDFFPDKLRNLHGYTMKVGLFHYPPYVFFNRNSAGDIVNFHGPDMLAVNALSKVLNFKVSKVISNKTTWDVSSCSKEKNVGLFRSAMYNELQFIGVKGSVSSICLGKLMEKSTITQPLLTVAVVPIFAHRLPKLSTQWKFHNAIVLVSLLLMTCVITRLLHFDNRNWRIEYLMQILLGLGIPREPRVLAERIVLGSVLLACVLQSSFIFTAFTSIDLKQKLPQEIKTIDDLTASGLKPLLLPNVHRYLKQQTDGKLMLLTERSIKKNITDEVCVQYLINYKNVTCFMRKSKANWLSKNSRDVNGQPVMRVLEQDLYDLISGYFLEAASPYVNRFKDVMSRFVEAGVMSEWDEHELTDPKSTISWGNSFISDVVESNVQIRRNIFFLSIIGYTCSMLAYIAEVIVYYILKFINLVHTLLLATVVSYIAVSAETLKLEHPSSAQPTFDSKIMDLNSHIHRVIFFWLLITKYVCVCPEKHNFLKNLIRYIQHDREINQVMLLTDSKRSIPKMQELSQKISSSFQLMNFINTTTTDAQRLSQLPSFNNPRSTLFILIISSACNESLSTLSRLINFIAQLHPAKIRPKVLILIQVKMISSYNDLLRFTWSRQFLDTTVLELIKKKNSRQNAFIDFRQEVTNQHYFIPFTDTFVQKEYSLKSDLFPDKLRNLHGYTMKVGLFHYPPYVFFTRNSTGHIVSFDGPDILTLYALSKALNFRVSKFVSNKTTWDVNSCTKEKNVGLFHSVMYNKLQFIGVQGAASNICFRKLMEQVTSTRPLLTVAVVPIFADRFPKSSIEWKFYNAIALVSLIIMTWLLTRLLRFDNQNWRMEYLMQIILGLGIPREPRVLAERIVLGSMLLACVLQSSFIFTAFTSIELKRKSPQEIKTVDDLISSELKPLLLPNVHRYLKSQTEGKLILLTERSITKNITDELCVQYLINYKNVTCFMRQRKANWLIQNYRDVDGEPVMRVLEDYLYDLIYGNSMEAASPYVNRFGDVMRRFSEAGLMNKWDKNLVTGPKASISGDEAFILDVVESNVQIRRNIFLVLIFGYTFSLLAYIGEVLVYYFQKFLK